MQSIAIVVPTYKTASYIKEFHERLKASLPAQDWKLIFVDDGSPDDSWMQITDLASQYSRVVGIKLSRNFGQHAAITAGIHHAKAKWYVVMDGDLQDRPEDIALLYAEALKGEYQIIVAERVSSALGRRRSLGSWLFNHFFGWLSGLEVSEKIGNFRMFSDQVAEAYRLHPEQLRFFPALMAQVGFSQTKILLPRDERNQGNSSYSYRKLLNLALDAIISYSDKPLKLIASFGALITIFALFTALGYLVYGLLFGFGVPGFASIIVALLGLGGFQAFLISVVGLYAGQILKEAKRRPHFIVEAVINQRT